MRKKYLVIIMLALITFSFNACYYDKSDEIYPPAVPCDTDSMSYKNDIVVILNAKCYKCHSTDNAAFHNAPVLDTYDKLTVYASPTSKQLFNVVAHVNVDPLLFMPQKEPKISECDISKIKAWMDAGAPNN